ncbi:pyridoxamine 5'-phosphate oxidase family protein [Cupriavidus sp. SK-4]|uniref:pyridoxamine 5'-phosphate oxidase family protein n=1 Tax=Cupriavidus sp. SK-4 TaxID=574750 RepID=UPI0005644DFF|nr:pyridoxamine 5'-phosphate oxidase family protein [Cupriavidus sp. SK-4]
MRLSEEIRRFIASPVMIIVGTRDTVNRPSIGRAVGARVVDEENVELVLSAWQWPATTSNLSANGQAAVTFSRPTDYVSYQLKGTAQLRAAAQPDLELSRRYQAEMVELFSGLGLPAELVMPWMSERELTVARVLVREAYVQTPGPKAGTAAGTDVA